jgi:hypothetical protein
MLSMRDRDSRGLMGPESHGYSYGGFGGCHPLPARCRTTTLAFYPAGVRTASAYAVLHSAVLHAEGEQLGAADHGGLLLQEIGQAVWG